MRAAGLDDAIAAVAPIVADVRDRGDAALLEWTERFDGPRPDGFRVPAERIAVGRRRRRRARGAPPHDRRGRGVHEAQRPADTSVEAAPGVVAERRWVPLDSVGVYVPSGRSRCRRRS